MVERTESSELITSKGHHAPAHRFLPGQTYIVTAGTLYRQHFFRTNWQLRYLEKTLLDTLSKSQWSPHVWSVFSNHYHFVAHDIGKIASLEDVAREFHSVTSIWLNKRQNTPGTQIWYQYWDQCLTFESSYLARLNYVNNNPVHHGLVNKASDYPYCSARLFETQASARFLRRLSTYGYKRVRLYDEFEPIWEVG